MLNSSAFSQALAVYQRTGVYPNITVGGSSIGAQALRYALTRLGDPYVWGAAGPSAFDCSGLVLWSYAQVGIQPRSFHRGPVERGPAHPAAASSSRVTWSSSSPTSATSACMWATA